MKAKKNVAKRKPKNKENMEIDKTRKTVMDYFIFFVIAAAVIQLLLLIYRINELIV